MPSYFTLAALILDLVCVEKKKIWTLYLFGVTTRIPCSVPRSRFLSIFSNGHFLFVCINQLFNLNQDKTNILKINNEVQGFKKLNLLSSLISRIHLRISFHIDFNLKSLVLNLNSFL